jgi:hypothetical protein
MTMLAACGGGADQKSDPTGPPSPPPPPVDDSREWTVLVYMAADNNLAVSGIFDLDEMEAAAHNPKVQVVVQAEYNREALAQQQCDFRCFNRPNWNTFRYAVQRGGSESTGPNGDAIDIGNRNMVDPAQLREFIQWGKQTYPAKHYAVVLWNHGGGYAGLLQDITSAGSSLMSVGQLRSALSGVGPIDLVDFDMCLMGGYETLAELKGIANYVVFSEEVVPGDGLPYKQVVEAFNAGGDTRTIAGRIADSFDASYANGQPSTTISAYDMTQFDAFDGKLGALADALQANVGTLAPEIAAAAASSQKYTYRELTDLVDFLDKLAGQPNMTGLASTIAELKAQATSGFRIRSHARNGSNQDAGNVSRSTGLHIVMPSGGADDQLAESGPRSFAAYQALAPDAPWTRFLSAYLNARPTTNVADQGENRFESYLVWSPDAVAAQADVDLWVYEPDGNIYAPAIGTITPNGSLSGDSFDKSTYYEGYLTNRYLQYGTYVFFASLYADPQNFRPQFDFVIRQGQTSSFSSIYDPDYPQLSTDVSWKDDPSATIEKIAQGAYTDIKVAYAIRVGPAAAGSRAGVTASRIAPRFSVSGSGSAAATPVPRVTAAQLATIRRALDAAHARPAAPRGRALKAPSGLPTVRRLP